MNKNLLLGILLSVGLVFNTFAQDRSITGKVTSSEDGSAVPGVNVTVKGTTKGTTTDAAGVYRISVPEKATLVFSSVGFNRKEVKIGTQATVDVELATDSEALSEVVVVGYGEQSRKKSTTSVVSVNSKDIANRPVNGIDQALQGNAPGVLVTSQSGTPGGGVSVNIRGVGSVTGSSQPLYVVDGVPINTGNYARVGFGNQGTNALNDINPNDIERVDILKDASAAAIYGSQASNGVVLITTKRGKAGKTQVSFDAYYGVQDKMKDFGTISGADETILLQEMLVNRYATANAAGGFSTPGAGSGNGVWASGADFAAWWFGPNATTNTVNGRLTVVESPTDIARGARTKAIFSDPNTAPSTRWSDYVLQQSITKNYDLSVRGGNERTKFSISTSLFENEGIVVGSKFRRLTGMLNLDQTVSSKFRLGGKMSFSRTLQDRIGNDNNIYGVVSGAFLMASDIPAFLPDGSYGKDGASSVDNPIASAKEPYNLTVNGRILSGVYGEYDLLKNLTFRSSMNVDYVSYRESRFLPTTTNQGVGTSGSGTETSSSDLNWYWSNYLNYNTTFNNVHNVRATVGVDYQESVYEAVDASATAFPGNAIRRLSAGATKTDASSTGTSWGLVSYYGRLNYDFMDKYILSASLRADGSSRFGANNRWGYFPAVSAAWRASKESFLADSKLISDLKVRLSYGINGNSSIGNFSSLPLSGSGGINYAGSGGLAPIQVANPDLKWETTTSIGAGIDLGLWKDRIVLAIDYYNRKTNDLLLNVPIPATSGFTTVTRNIGSLENKGWEFGLTAIPVQTKKVRWSSTVSLAFNTNVITSLGGVRPFAAGFASWVQEGQSLGAFRGFVTNGIIQTAQELAEYKAIPGVSALTNLGDLKFKDVNGRDAQNNETFQPDGRLTADDQQILGNALPLFQGGFNNDVTFGNFDLKLFFNFSYGNKIWNHTRVFSEGMNGVFGQTNGVLNRWTPTNTTTTVPRAVWGDPNQNRRNSDRFLEDGSFLRLRTVTLGYNFPKAVASKIKLDRLRLYVSAQNLWTLTNYKGLDPEVSTFNQSNTAPGTDFLTFPQMRTYTFGLNIGF